MGDAASNFRAIRRFKIICNRNSLAVQWLRLGASTAGGAGSFTGRGTKIPREVRRGQKKRESVMCSINVINVTLISVSCVINVALISLRVCVIDELKSVNLPKSSFYMSQD